MPRQVDYYFSFQSPWAYIGHKPFRELVSTYDLKVNHKPVVLVDLFSETGGLPLMKRHPVRQRYRMVELQRWRDKRGLEFHLQPANWPFNARLADGVVIAAIEAGLDPDRFPAAGFCRRCGKTSSISRIPRRWQDSPTNPGFPARAGGAFGVRRDQRGLRAEPAGCAGGRRVRLAGLCARRRGVLGAGPDRIAGGRVEVGPRALSLAGVGSAQTW